MSEGVSTGFRDRGFQPWHGLAAAGALGPVLALAAPLGMAPFSIVVLLFTLSMAWRDKPWRLVSPRVALALAVPVGWALLSLAWSEDPLQGVKTGSGVVLELAGGLLLVGVASGLDGTARRKVGLALAIGVTIALALLLIEITVGGIFHYIVASHVKKSADVQGVVLSRLSRGQTVVTLFALPAMLMAWRAGLRAWALSIGVALCVVSAGGHPLSMKVALPLAGLAYLTSLKYPRRSATGISVGAALIICSMPLLAYLPSPQQIMDATEAWLPRSAHHRLTIWSFGAKRSLEKPILGWGLDMSRSIPGGDDEIVITISSPRYGNYALSEAQMPLHPHNVAVQIWLELGAIGAALVILAITVLTRHISRIDDGPARAVAVGALIVVLTVDLVSYGMWQSWWLCTIGLGASLIAVATGRMRPPIPEGGAGKP